MVKIKNERLLAVKKEIKKEKERDRYFALDLETTTWKAENEDLTPIKPIFGVLSEFHPETFEMINNKVFNANEIQTLLESLVNRSSKNTLFVYVHNLDFDFLFLLNPFLRMPERYRIYPIIVGSRIIKVSVLKKEKCKEKIQYRTLVEFRNTFCLISKSLKKIGQEIGFEKLSNDFETINEGLITEKDIEYCKRDNQVVVKLLETWYKTMRKIGLNLELEKISLTSASSAFKLFKAIHSEERFNPNTKKKEKFCPWILDSMEMNKEFRDFYFGGRTEVFDFNLIENVDYYDINSLYPYVMSRLVMKKPPYYGVQSESEMVEAFAYELIVDESEQQIPIFPQRINGKVCFTAMKEKHVFCFTEELEYLKTEKIPYKIVKAWISRSEWEKPFEYIAKLYDLRKELENEGQKALAGSIKIIMNSTYGRFALQTEREHLEIEEFRKEHVENYTDIYRDLGVIKEREEIVAEINVVMACKITALARLEITKKAREITKNGYKIYYMDTDSLVVSHGSIEESKELGGFKIEKKFDWFQGISAKDYTGQENGKKMFKTKGSRIDSFKEYLKYHSEGLMNIRPIKLKELLRIYHENKIDTLEPVQRNVLKRYISVYDKRYINEDLTTRPLNDSDTIEETKINNANKIAIVFSKIEKNVDQN